MSHIGGASDSAVDTAFLVIQAIAFVGWLLAIATTRWQQRLPRRWHAALALAVVTDALGPVVWNMGFPPHDGIEGAGRFFMGMPVTLVNGALSCVWALTDAAGAGQARWRATWPFVAVVSAGVALWIVSL